MSDLTGDRTRVLLVDDHRLVLMSLKMLLDTQPDFEVVGIAGNAEQALSLTQDTQPDIILLDLNLDGEPCYELVPKLREVAAGARVVILTGEPDAEAHRKAVKLGAVGLVRKESAPELLTKAIRKVHGGEVWLDRTMMGNLIAEFSRGPDGKKPDEEAKKIATLTERERDVISLIGEGLRNKAIAERLFISETTVRHHLTSIFDKLCVGDRLELVIYAYRHGLAKPPQ